MSDWDTIIGFVFYVAPCTAFAIWLTDISGEGGTLFQLGLTIAAILVCTGLWGVMQSPATTIDLMLEELRNPPKPVNLYLYNAEQAWMESDAPYKARCPHGLCISYHQPIYCIYCDNYPVNRLNKELRGGN